LSGSRHEVSSAPNLGHRAIAIPDLEAAIRDPRLNRQKNLQDDVDFRKTRSSFRCQADEAGSNKETDDACDGVREGYRRQRKGISPHARGEGGDGQI
jgi:hypothetical protein